MAKLKDSTVMDLINPKSKNLKKLALDVATINEDDAIKVLQNNPKVMYRPILTDGHRIVVGFKEEEFRKFS